MECPRCNGMMFDNTLNKKNPKGPDYRCKDKECIDPETGYVTAVWLPKEEVFQGTKPKPRPLPVPPVPKIPENNGKSGEQGVKAMIFAYSKDLVVAQIAGGVCPSEPTKEVIAVFMAFWQAYKEV